MLNNPGRNCSGDKIRQCLVSGHICTLDFIYRSGKGVVQSFRLGLATDGGSSDKTWIYIEIIHQRS